MCNAPILGVRRAGMCIHAERGVMRQASRMFVGVAVCGEVLFEEATGQGLWRRFLCKQELQGRT